MNTQEYLDQQKGKGLKMHPEIKPDSLDKACEVLHNIEFVDQANMIEAIVRVSRLIDSAPQINLDEVERFVLELADRSARDYSYEEHPNFKDHVAKYAAIFRKLIGYTIVDGKAVAIQKGGEGNG